MVVVVLTVLEDDEEDELLPLELALALLLDEDESVLAELVDAVAELVCVK